MSWVDRVPSMQRSAVCAILAATPLLITTGAYDPVHLVKATALLVGAATLFALTVTRILAARSFKFPDRWLLLAAGALVVAIAVTVAAADVFALGLTGPRRRYSGGIVYVAGLLVFALTASCFDRATARSFLVPTMALAGGVVGAYALVQQAGWDPLPWQVVYEGAAFSTMGNPNFAAGFLAISLPIVAIGALSSESRRIWRLAGTGICGVIVLGMIATGARQGPVAAAIGFVPLSWVWYRWRRDAWPTWRRRATLGAGLAVVVGMIWLVVQLLPRMLATAGVSRRLLYWQAARNMLFEHPLTGVGFGRYGAYYREYRTVEDALSLGLRASADSAHSVPLELLATGGLLVGLSYLALVALVGWTLLRGLAGQHGSDLLTLGGVGGGWLAYQAQSAISIDVPALLAAHWILAGVIVASAGRQGVAMNLPPRPRRRTGRADARRWSGGWAALAGFAVVLPLLWAVSVPVRADLEAGRGERLVTAGDLPGAVAAFDRARERAPWEPEYVARLGDVLIELGDTRSVEWAYAEAVARDPRNFGNVAASARVAAAIGDADTAWQRYASALELEPTHPSLKIEVAEFAFEVGRVEEARQLAREVLLLSPTDERARQLLEDLPRA